MSYGKTRNDLEYLETIYPLDHWVEIQGDMLLLMENPTKKKAEDYYLSCILLWFGEARLDGRELNKRSKTIKDRYGAF